MIPRTAQDTLQRFARGFPVLAITGPRQSGKTTLARMVFPDKPYLSLENPDVRSKALEDPDGLLKEFVEGAILDEVQRAPELFSYLQTLVDSNYRAGAFVLTGSQQFGLLSKVTQSLAGRVGMLQLLPFSMAELASVGQCPATFDELLFKGCYPPLYDHPYEPGDWFGSYEGTYVERDVRQLIGVRDLSQFQRFVRMCAARVGQLLNLSSLASDCGISHPTASAWLSVLEAGYIVHLLRPHFQNFNKRLVKAPKLYFWDVGLAGWLLGIREPGQIFFHSHRGALFENLIINEFLKGRLHRGLPVDAYFWRDNHGLEVDLLLEREGRLHPVEIKSGKTLGDEGFRSLEKWAVMAGQEAGQARLVYGGDLGFRRHDVEVVPWRRVGEHT